MRTTAPATPTAGIVTHQPPARAERCCSAPLVWSSLLDEWVHLGDLLPCRADARPPNVGTDRVRATGNCGPRRLARMRRPAPVPLSAS
jgi:hypothetical protein